MQTVAGEQCFIVSQVQGKGKQGLPMVLQALKHCQLTFFQRIGLSLSKHGHGYAHLQESEKTGTKYQDDTKLPLYTTNHELAATTVPTSTRLSGHQE